MRPALVTVLSAVTAVTASATIATYSDRATFLAAAGATTLIDFNGVAAGNLVPFNTSAGVTLSNVQFIGTTGNAALPNVLSVVRPGFFPAYDRGGLLASLVGPLNPAHGPDPKIVVNAPAAEPFYAAGFDLYSVQAGDGFPYAKTDTVVIHVDGSSYSVPTVAINVGNGLVFFGFISTTPISSFVIETSSMLNANTAIGRFVFSTTPLDTAVPEPTTTSTIAVGLIGALVRSRRKR